MKSTTYKLTIAAAFLVVATGVASAQVLTADIPFAFRAGNRVMAPGAYIVDVKEANRLVFLTSREARQAAVLLAISTADASKAWKAAGDPVLAFECGSGRCTLTQVWTGYDSPAMSLPHRTPAGTERAALTLIRLVRASAD